MILETVKKGLSTYPEVEVQNYINYLNKLQTDKITQNGPTKGQLKNKWFAYFKEAAAIDLFKKVALDGLYIEGETITLQNKGGVTVSYNFQAYKNKLLIRYPETAFDLQNVYKGDVFTLRKESGKVAYSHTIADPFAVTHTDDQITGCYCIIKNKRGEFIETLNLADLTKMRAVAKTQNIWKNWFSEMTLKSVIKRACKRHFNDIVQNIEKLDNENYKVDQEEILEVEITLQEQIDACETRDELKLVHNANIENVENEKDFLKMLNDRREEIINEKSNA